MNSRILLVEDEPGLVLTVSDLLATEGYAVDTAMDGETALAKAMSGNFEVIILDVMLPKRTGFEVCRELRQRGVDTAILMLTAKTQVVDRVVGLKLGADDYLPKPFDPDFERAEVRRAGQPIGIAVKKLQLLQYLVHHQLLQYLVHHQLLQYLVHHRDRVIPREEILSRSGNTIATSPRAPSTSISRGCGKSSITLTIPATSKPFAARDIVLLRNLSERRRYWMREDTRMRTLARFAIAAGLPWMAFAFQADFNWSGSLSPGQTLTVKNVNGFIHGELASGNAIEVAAHKTAHRSDPNSVQIQVVPTADGVTICTVYPGDSNDCESTGRHSGNHERDNDVVVDFTVKVPAGVNFAPHTVNGTVRAMGLKSDVNASSVNGNVHAQTSGLVRATTVNGSIEAAMGASTWEGALSFSSVNGSIDITMPAAIDADVQASSVNGGISSEFPLTMNGALNKHSIKARIGAGGHELTFSTVNGAIALHQGTI